MSELQKSSGKRTQKRSIGYNTYFGQISRRAGCMCRLPASYYNNGNKCNLTFNVYTSQLMRSVDEIIITTVTVNAVLRKHTQNCLKFCGVLMLVSILTQKL